MTFKVFAEMFSLGAPVRSIDMAFNWQGRTTEKKGAKSYRVEE